MIPPRDEIDRVRRDTGMGELQAIRHVQARETLRLRYRAVVGQRSPQHDA